MLFANSRLIVGCVLAGVVVASAAGLKPALTRAQDFRVETDVFVDDEKQPVVETLTIFSNGVVYDFMLSGDQEITILDPKHGRLVLLDSQRRLKTTLSTESILDVVSQLRERLGDDERAEFVEPEMETVFEEQTGMLTLTGKRVTYRAVGMKPKNEDAAQQYRRFADWYARLNSMRVGNVPPYARIQLNAELADRQLMPKEVERVIVVKKTLATDVEHRLRSQHLAIWRLSNTDHKWIDKAGECLASFAEVRPTEYFQAQAQAQAEAQEQAQEQSQTASSGRR